MSLRFDADTENVNCGSASDIDDLTSCTIFAVVRATVVDTSRHTISDKGAFPSVFKLRTDTAGAGELSFDQAYATTFVTINTNSTPVTVDSWMAVFAVSNGTSSVPRMYTADLPGDLAEVGYAVQTTGAGARTTDAAANLVIGQDADNTTRSWEGDIARYMLFGAALSLQQCEAVLHDPWFAFTSGLSLLRWFEPGYNGTTNVPDLSNIGTAGTITGATLSAPAPIPLVWTPRQSAYFVPDDASDVLQRHSRGIHPALLTM